jgi:hypothetical protein
MSLLQTVDDFNRLLQLMLPVAMPDDQNIVRWLDTFTDSEIEYALNRTRRKFLFLPAEEPVEVYKYVSSVLRNERAARKAGGA